MRLIYFSFKPIMLLSPGDLPKRGSVVPDVSSEQVRSQIPRSGRRRELITFLVLAFGIWPVVAVGVVGGYGFLVWMYQIVFGPPGPPGG
jgi:nitrate reductase NapE